MKIAYKLSVLAFFLLVLTSCSGPSAKTESDILSDIQYQDDYFGSYGLTIDSSNITKRQTNPDDKTDYVWVELNASNDMFTYYAEYYLYYVLYNEGWQLENCEISCQEYEVRDYESISQSDADAVIAAGSYDEYFYIYRDNTFNQVDFYYIASTSQMFLKTDYDIRIRYTFRPNFGWSTPVVDVQPTNYYPDLVGTWRSNKYDMELTVNVLTLEKTGDRDFDMTFTCNFTNAAVNDSRYSRVEGRHTYIQETPLTINIHHATTYNNAQHWNADNFTLVATDGSSHEFDFLIDVGGQGGIVSWNTNESVDGCGIGWSEWQPLFLEKDDN